MKLAALMLALALAALAVVLVVWTVRPWFHWPAMLLYQYPLVTWIPVVLGLAAGGALHALSRVTALGTRARLGGLAVMVLAWGFFMVMLPGWQGRALYEATVYQEGAELPFTTQPRLLPKEAAERYGNRDSLHDAHLVVDPTSRDLTWSAEQARGLFRRGDGEGVAVQPLDRVDGSLRRLPARFDRAASRLGPGSIKWRGYKRHYFTRIQDRIIVPLGDRDAVAIAPYVGYRGFPVRRPYLKGVYVYHRDGRLEDLTVEQALARPELARSGRIFPEKLARDIAEAYGYESGSGAVFADRPRSSIDDPDGNPQPYLTNLGDGRIQWVTVGHPDGRDDVVSTVFLTDGATGATQLWHAPKGRLLLSNQGAADLARDLPREWNRRVCCDSEGDSYTVWIRKATEPRPVFAGGRLYYLVSIIPNPDWVNTREPVDQTVLVDGHERRIIEIFDHSSADADDRLRAFFDERGKPRRQPVEPGSGP